MSQFITIFFGVVTIVFSFLTFHNLRMAGFYSAKIGRGFSHYARFFCVSLMWLLPFTIAILALNDIFRGY